MSIVFIVLGGPRTRGCRAGTGKGDGVNGTGQLGIGFSHAGTEVPWRSRGGGRSCQVCNGNRRTSSVFLCSRTQSHLSEASHAPSAVSPHTLQTSSGLTQFCRARQDASEMEGDSSIDRDLRELGFGYATQCPVR